MGVYEENSKDEINFTRTAKAYNDKVQGKLAELLKIAGPVLGKGKTRIFYNLNSEFPVVAAVGLGKDSLKYNELEELDEGREAIRIAASAGCRGLQDVGVTEISVEDLGNAEAAAEGATLGVWKYQENKRKEKQTKIPIIKFFEDSGNDKEENWKQGVIKAEAQNLARRLADTPANLMTPTIFAQNAVALLSQHNIDVQARNKAWAEKMKMGSFLSVCRGSEEPPIFLELHYRGGNTGSEPVVFVGKGVTFDTGGISLKTPGSMDEMRGDMSGAACVLSSIQAAAALKLPINVTGLIPLTENMPSGRATKPGDLVTAMNGKTIIVDNTDAEGRLILADALCYSKEFHPKFLLDIATLTGAMRVALAQGATGAFTNSADLFKKLQKSGSITGDRMWRMPLWNHYSKQVTDFPSADVNNVGKGKGGGSCTAAAFLREFVPKCDWVHLDIAGVMGPSDTLPYLHKGMSGRPTRTLIELLARHSRGE